MFRPPIPISRGGIRYRPHSWKLYELLCSAPEIAPLIKDLLIGIWGDSRILDDRALHLLLLLLTLRRLSILHESVHSSAPTQYTVHPGGLLVASPVQLLEIFSAAPALVDLTLSGWQLRLHYLALYDIHHRAICSYFLNPQIDLSGALLVCPSIKHLTICGVSPSPPPLSPPPAPSPVSTFSPTLRSLHALATTVQSIATLLLCAQPNPRLARITLATIIEAGDAAQWTAVGAALAAGPLHGSVKCLKIRGLYMTTRPQPVLPNDWAASIREGLPSLTGPFTPSEDPFIPARNGEEGWYLNAQSELRVVLDLEFLKAEWQKKMGEKTTTLHHGAASGE
ncbi:hypothetical protein B0H10DRAFT_2434978 [Mycena sp. CBHHK59/15]|nr:hypothetical protein B0H10DRAFT_2434978 [Mycena sp. CBHHK59/15]